ncbi:hypothetical protein EK21DRAFT_112826 [Setomelanomma holmii]|uniref:Uncharacterized protein n=1 Tax=Setomelanomma holmii TaxID=210430 RepID=A0A9P4HA91_9PLEO|nr:hypothetical protein EK21DRAFT_112826 [Setomelanomma holmii]
MNHPYVNQTQHDKILSQSGRLGTFQPEEWQFVLEPASVDDIPDLADDDDNYPSLPSSDDSEVNQYDIPIDPALYRMYPPQTPSQHQGHAIVDDMTPQVAPGELGFAAWPEDILVKSLVCPDDMLAVQTPYGSSEPKDQNELLPSTEVQRHLPIHVDDFMLVQQMIQASVRLTPLTISDVPASGLHFGDLPDAANAAQPLRHWTAPTVDATLPTSDLERRQWVVKLVDALNNATNVFDAPSRITKRWLSSPPYYTDMAKELVAWKILGLTEAVQTKGSSALISFDTTFWKNAAKSRAWTFVERMNKIIELLTCSKARCEKLLAGLGLQLVIANSDVVLRTTKDNGKQNYRRQAILVAGRAAADHKAAEIVA